MGVSSSTLNVFKLALAWLALGGTTAIAITNIDTIRTALGTHPDQIEAVRGEREETAIAGHVAPAPRQASVSGAHRTVELRAGNNGHFHARALINGRQVETLVDTGASIVALTWEDATSAGIHVRNSDFRHQVNTANGTARVAIVTLDSVSIEDIEVRNVRAAVAEPGKLTTTLLGMSFLGQLSRAEMRRGTLILQD